MVALVFDMTSRNPRVMLTLPADLDYVFKRLSELEGKPKTRVIVEYLDSIRPHAESMIEAFDALKDKKANPVEVLQKLTAGMMIAMGEFGREIDKNIKEVKKKPSQES